MLLSFMREIKQYVPYDVRPINLKPVHYVDKASFFSLLTRINFLQKTINCSISATYVCHYTAFPILNLKVFDQPFSLCRNNLFDIRDQVNLRVSG